ncbi:MAG: hypothetical protein Q8O83_01630 [bacterium]|nr:hypothetical protein [bacterium]
MNKESPDIKNDAEKIPNYTMEFSQTNFETGPNECILKIVINENGEEKTLEAHWPKEGIQLFDPQTKRELEFVSPKTMKKMYDQFMSLNPSYHALMEMRETRSLLKFFWLSPKKQKDLVDLLNMGSTKKEAERIMKMPEEEQKNISKENPVHRPT